MFASSGFLVLATLFRLQHLDPHFNGCRAVSKTRSQNTKGCGNDMCILVAEHGLKAAPLFKFLGFLVFQKCPFSKTTSRAEVGGTCPPWSAGHGQVTPLQRPATSSVACMRVRPWNVTTSENMWLCLMCDLFYGSSVSGSWLPRISGEIANPVPHVSKNKISKMGLVQLLAITFVFSIEKTKLQHIIFSPMRRCKAFLPDILSKENLKLFDEQMTTWWMILHLACMNAIWTIYPGSLGKESLWMLISTKGLFYQTPKACNISLSAL